MIRPLLAITTCLFLLNPKPAIGSSYVFPHIDCSDDSGDKEYSKDSEKGTVCTLSW